MYISVPNRNFEVKFIVWLIVPLPERLISIFLVVYVPNLQELIFRSDSNMTFDVAVCPKTFNILAEHLDLLFCFRMLYNHLT